MILGRASAMPRSASRSRTQGLRHVDPGAQPVLVEAVAEPGTRVPEPALALDPAHLPLGRHGRPVERRVRVVELGVDQMRVRLAQRVERHEQVLGAVQVLEPVHPVGDGHPRLRARAGRRQVVPARPHAAPARHQRRIAVQDGTVGLVAEGPQERAFLLARVLEHGEAPVGMAGEHHLVEPVALAPCVEELDP
jgi:hypothetical protein